jgi:pimeloyl-ACP methyl ester carboxylesterase
MQGWQKLATQRLLVIPGAAHHARLERPEAYGAHFEAFLQAQEESESTDQKRHR